MTSTLAALQPSALRRVQSRDGSVKFVVMDALTQLMPHWGETDRREHLHSFRERDGLPPFARVYMPSASGENGRKVANTVIVDVPCMMEFICSLPCDPKHLIEQAWELQRHTGQEPSMNLKCRPLHAKQPTSAELLRRRHHVAVRQPTRSSQDVCAAVLATLPPLAATSKGRLFQYRACSIHGLLDESGSPWFRGIAVAEALRYYDPKGALKQHVSKQRKQKREKLPMTAVLPRCEREAIWINTQGVRDLVVGQGNEEGERFWRWLIDEVLPQMHPGGNEEHTLNAESQAPIYSTSEVFTEKLVASLKAKCQYMVLEYQLMQVLLARCAKTVSDELGLPLPPTLQAEYLMRAAGTQDPEPRSAPAAEEVTRLHWANQRHDEMNSRLHKKLQRIELAVQARRMAHECGLPVRDSQLLAERQALEMAATPHYLDEDGWMTAGDYLRLRGHSEDETQQLQTSFGRTLKLHQAHRGETSETVCRDYGYVQKEMQTCIYHAQRDRALLNAAYQAFALTDLYRRIVPPAVQAINNL
jgi:prophage antirepressor-like protein